MKFRKKSVVIDAIRLLPWNVKECMNFMGGECIAFARPLDSGIAISTLEGTMHASYGDWIIKGVEGEFYPCKPNIFDATYESVNEEEVQCEMEQDN